ncbi:cysteine desulfurase [Taibaiella lutea]|uniref:cysteine desulfurase n=1 Tax=Taibaiella lutea TaxID=2608001 RepID=A0A5M6CQW0_9BACT|nr:cysteine desulfurase family protein [Taibaiella lutea]KAA5537343.1 cysteine desulfurase [Taibaiella lutea]
MIYLDYNATTPCDAEVLKTMLPYFTEKFGNAASKTHPYGWIADEAVTKARKEIARLINAADSEIVFTSGSTEGCNLALKGIYENYASKGNHIITCRTEHKAVLDTCQHLEKQGAEVTYLGVDSKGLINLSELEEAIRPETILIALMYANNETGVIHPVKEIGIIAKRHKVLFFSDATQAIGKCKVDVEEDEIDILAMSAHKFYGPKGVGALYIRRRNPRVSIAAQIDGGGHERGFRSGTLNVPGIVGMGKATALCFVQLQEERDHIRKLRDRLETGLVNLGNVIINGDTAKRLPNVTNLSFEGIGAEKLLSLLNGEIAFSLGSACTSASKEPSHVLAAMHLEDSIIKESIRLSLGRFTTDEEINMAIQIFGKAIKRLRHID